MELYQIDDLIELCQVVTLSHFGAGCLLDNSVLLLDTNM